MTTLLRVTLAFVAFSIAVPGLQATISPSAFYEGFPFGRAWVQMLPPYNEHLIRDVGNYEARVRDPVRVGRVAAVARAGHPARRGVVGRGAPARRLSRPCTWTVSAPATLSR